MGVLPLQVALKEKIASKREIVEMFTSKAKQSV